MKIFTLSKQPGFTLIETLIVFAIIVILALVAVPAIQNYEIQKQAADSLSLADPVKKAIAEAALKGDISTASNANQAAADALGLPLNTSINNEVVASVTLAGTSAAGANPQTASITILYKTANEAEPNIPAPLSGKTLVLIGTLTAESAVWSLDTTNSTLSPVFQPKI